MISVGLQGVFFLNVIKFSEKYWMQLGLKLAFNTGILIYAVSAIEQASEIGKW